MNYNGVEMHAIVMSQEGSRLLAVPSLFHLFIHFELWARAIVVSSIHRYCDSDSTGANMRRGDIAFRHHHGDVANIGPELHVAAIVYYHTVQYDNTHGLVTPPIDLHTLNSSQDSRDRSRKI